MSAPSYLAENVIHFARTLRRAGLAIGPRQAIEAVAAVRVAGLENRHDFYWALHATLINHHEDHVIFDQAFRIFWRNPQLLERTMALMLPEIKSPHDPESEEASRRLAEALLDTMADSRDPGELDLEVDASETMSAAEVLRQKDFEQMSTLELADAKAALARLRWHPEEQPSRRSAPATHGNQIDLRATLRASLRNPATIPLKLRRQKTRQTPLVVLCDISGSMSLYARVFLHFLHAQTNDHDRVHTFLFGTRLTDVTRHLKHKDIDVALAEVASAVEDWDGGTRIGQTLHRFNVDWSRRVLGQGATVLLITDGLDRDAGEGLEKEIEKLHRTSRRLIWLNPLLRYTEFQPKATGIRAMLPHVDEFRAVHNIQSLADLVDALNAPQTRRRAA